MRNSIKAVLLGLLLIMPAVQGLEDFRKPVAAGTFYPADPETLKNKVESLITQASTPPDTGRMIACLMPNAAYGFSGSVAAHAVKNIQPGDYETIVVLGTSHYVTFENCTVPAVRSFMTPMGFVPLDEEKLDKLNYSPLFWTKAIRYTGSGHHTPIHEKEYSVEVVLPFLQSRLGIFKLVPVLVGQLNNQSQGINYETIESVSEALRKIIDDKTLIVASSNLTHYGQEYNYAPFRENIEQHRKELDDTALDLISKVDTKGFIDYLKKTKNPIPGYNAILLMMQSLPPGTTGRLVSQDRSSNMLKAGNSDSSVTYAAIQFFAPTPKPKD